MENTSAAAATATSSQPLPHSPASEDRASSFSSWTAAVRERFTMPNLPFRGVRPAAASFDYYPNGISNDDRLSCGAVAIVLWVFASIALIECVFGPTDIHTGPYSSILLQPNPLFVHSLKVENLKALKMPSMVYGFHRAPPLGITKIWSESLYASVKPESNKVWTYFLNEGSQINISYNMPSSSSLLLIIAEGTDEIVDWLADPSNPEATLSWNVIYGNGTIMQDVIKSSEYIVGVGNVNSDDVEVNLSLSVRSSMYDTTNFSCKCDLTGGSCKLVIPFPGSHAAVLTSPGPQEGEDEVYVKVFYEPRWLTYLLGGIILIMIWGFNLLRGLLRSDGDSAESDSAPLLSHKDDDLSSLCSCDSGSENGDEPHENLENDLGVKGGVKKYNARRCVICLAASKDCFYIPCGHNASCYTCGTRIVEDAGICPICRRSIKVVRRIYNV